jgi:hypothetical protein
MGECGAKVQQIHSLAAEVAGGSPRTAAREFALAKVPGRSSPIYAQTMESSQESNNLAPKARGPKQEVPIAPPEMTQKLAADVKPGDIVILQGHPVRVTDVVHAKPGKH